MEFALGKIYAKFYICQILNAQCYYEMTQQQLELQQLIEDNYINDIEVDPQAMEITGNINKITFYF